jgi:glycerol kinase
MIVTLDLGTTSIRCLALDPAGQFSLPHQQVVTQHFPQPGWVEHDAREIWQTTQSVFSKTLQELPEAPTAVAVTNQRETVVAWDAETHEPLHMAIVWQCRRTAERMASIPKATQARIKAKTGLLCDAYFSASKLEWLLHTVPAVQDAANRGTLRVGTIDSWILFKLTDGQVHATDSSNAARTLLFNIHTHNYDPELLALFGIHRDWLPQVYPSDHHFGCVAPSQLAHTPYANQALPIHAILGDQQAALFAQCGDDTTRIKNTYGTGLFVCASTGTTPQTVDTLLTTIAWQRGATTTYAIEGSIFVGGSAIQWCRDALGLIDTAADSADLALSLDHNDTVYFVPALTGLGAPHWDSSARGLFIGLTRGTTKAHLIRAVLEAMAYQTKDVVDLLPSAHELHVDGGASDNPFLMQFQADMLGMPVIKSAMTESTAYGVAGLAGITMGLFTEAEFRTFHAPTHRYTPTFKPETIRVYYSQWTAAVTRSRHWV